MYFSLILFFISLIGIVFMIGRKLVLLRSGEMLTQEEILFEVSPFEKVKHVAIKNTKKYGHLGLVATIRIYIKTANLIKYKYEKIVIKMKGGEDGSNKEKVSKFLKMVLEYKNKIRDIKHRITEEENL